MKLVTAKSDHPANAIFRVDGQTKNGWLRCSLHSDQRGQRLSSDYVFKFRVADMKEIQP